jgi:peptidoglycan/LPS O-acetylase OafA/YrhL
MKASSICFPAAVLLVLVGMLWGIEMAISQDHSTMPAHAHLNLLGWVSLFLFGIFYHLHPRIDGSRIARALVYIWIAGTVILTVGVGLVHTGYDVGDPIAAVGSLIVLLGMVMFGAIVVRRRKGEHVAGKRLTPAE